MWKSDNRGHKSFGHLCNSTNYLWFNTEVWKKGAAFLLRTVYFSLPLQYSVENQKKLQVVVSKIVYSESWEDAADDRSRWPQQMAQCPPQVVEVRRRKDADHSQWKESQAEGALSRSYPNLPHLQPMRQRLSLSHWTYQSQPPLSLRHKDHI